MKSDKVVDASEESTDNGLFFVIRISQIYLFQIRIMEVYNRFPLRHFSHVVMWLSVGNTDSQECGVKISWWSDNIKVCTTVPYFDDEFTVDETRAARDENGKTKQIPADMSYDDWEREFAPVEAEIRTQKRAAYARRDYNYRSNNGKIDIEIDTFVPCLKDAETGEILDTVVKRIISPNELKGLNKKAGWYINWQKEFLWATACPCRLIKSRHANSRYFPALDAVSF